MPIHVAIIEDQKDTREMLAALINSSEDYACVAAYNSSEEALSHLPNLLPDVVLVDIHLPGLSGTDSVKQLKTSCPGTKFIMCTSLEDAEHIFKALQAGAIGYLTKSTTPAKILEAIQDAHNGGAPMSSQIARKVISYFQEKEEKINKELEKLSVREREILEFLSKGYRYKEIAALMYLNIETVRKHIHNIYEKLHVNSRTDALNKVFPKG